jgi:hypothetical protein
MTFSSSTSFRLRLLKGDPGATANARELITSKEPVLLAWRNNHLPGNSNDAQRIHRSIVALIAGILILLRPQLLNLIVAIYLIVIGVLGLLGQH